MNNLYNFNEYILLEKKNTTNQWTQIVKNIKKDLNFNLFLVAKFGMGITSFMPIIKHIITNKNIDYDFSPVDIAMLTICAMAILVDDNQDAIKKLKEKLKEKNILNFLDDVIKAVKSIKRIIATILVRIGRIASSEAGLLDLFAYTSFLVPILNIMNKLVIEHGVDIDLLIQIGNSVEPNMAIAAGMGFATLAVKTFLNKLLEKVSKTFGIKNENLSF